MRLSLPTAHEQWRVREDRLAVWMFVGNLLFMCAIVLGSILLTGCTSYIQAKSAEATQAAIDDATLAKNVEKYADAGAEIAKAATGAAVDRLKQDDTKEAIAALIETAGTQSRAELLATRDALLDDTLKTEIAGLTPSVRQLVRQLLDEALGPATQAEVDALMERAFGQPFRDKMKLALDDARPQITAIVSDATKAAAAQVQVTADAEASKFKWLVIALVVVVVSLLGVVIVMARVVTSHRMVIEKLVAARPSEGTA